MSIIKGKTGEWEIVVGVEVHAQIVSKSKLFSEAATRFGAAPNSQVSLVDCAMPGMLPLLNKECVRQAVLSGLALDAQINLHSVFDRKSYFYPDSPQGYQITQLYEPIAVNGHIMLSESSNKKIRIARLHIEQDAGKSMHISGKTFVDLNRVGVGLMEIVSEPDIGSIDEAAEFLRKLRSILRFIGSCDGDMEKGSFRCDANVSVRHRGTSSFGTRCEIKNLNSIRFVQQAILYEAQRQVDILEDGGIVQQCTMSFDTASGKTSILRIKEDASDYRYFPDPDLPPLILRQEFVDSIKREMPELPEAKRQRYIEDFGLSINDAGTLISDKSVALYFEEVAAVHDPKMSANWIIVELFGALNKDGLSILDSPINPERMIGLLDNIKNGVLSGKLAKEIFAHMFKSDESATEVIEKLGIRQVTNESEILSIITEVLESNRDKVVEYLSGKERMYGFFVGQIMKSSGGKANPEVLNKLLKEQLERFRQ